MNMRLFIAEKPELAKAIVTALGGGKRQDGYIDCGNDKITWCFGHMLSLYDPEDYNPQYKKWNLDHLPIVHIPWKKKIIPDKKKQINIIKKLMHQASCIVHAGDPDAEGQLLIDELLKYLNCKIPTKRILINDNNTLIVKKALQQLKENSDFTGLSASAEARGVADQLYGYNMTRLYTLAARKKGHQNVLSVGRVQTPILGMVVNRDRIHASHQKSLFYLVEGQFNFSAVNDKVIGKYQIQASDAVDDKNRLTDKAFAHKLTACILNQLATLTACDSKIKQRSAPLPYNLLKLQADSSRKFNIKPDKVLAITQSLREKHQLITYNRSDCEYLSDEQHADASLVLSAIANTAPILNKVANNADPTFKSKAFNSKKVTIHHGIVPTQTTCKWQNLSADEQKIYLLIARAYIAQFFPLHKYKDTSITIECSHHPITKQPLQFTANNQVTLISGWSLLYKNDIGNNEIYYIKNKDSKNFDSLKKNMQGTCTDSTVKEKETSPPALYTMSSLLKELTRTAKYVTDPKLKKILLEKDQNKSGEHGGIGTPATRSKIIKNLFDRNFLIEKGKHIIATDLGKKFFDLLPHKATSPDMTALWHEQQKEIEAGKLSVNNFIKELMNYLNQEIIRVKKHGLNINVRGIICPSCMDGILIKRSGKKNFFWGCSTYPECKATYHNHNNKPVLQN